MGIMPHRDVEQALELALSLDIPFWPQLPKVSFYEDMYAQVSEGFPGISVDVEHQRVSFDTTTFMDDLGEYSERMNNVDSFALSSRYSAVFHRFMEEDLSGYSAIRGQSTGPVSFGFKIVDEHLKPIIYNDEVRSVLFDFMQKKVNAQYREMVTKHDNAFVWLDEPGLGWVFNSLSGYNDIQAKEEYQSFMAGIESPKALHLCANVNLPYLLEFGLDILSFDAYQLATMPKAYANAVARFIESGKIISWGIVPTDSTTLSQENPGTLAQRIIEYWEVIAQNSEVSVGDIARHALIAPARCCLKNISAVGANEETREEQSGSCPLSSIEEQIVEKAFSFLPEISRNLREHYQI